VSEIEQHDEIDEKQRSSGLSG